MVAWNSPDSNKIFELLSRLKAETPEYPVKLLEARRVDFLRQAATLEVQSKDQGGEGGQQGGSAGSGGSGTALGGSTTVQGILLQSVIGLGFVASMLMGAYMFRNQASG